MRARRSRRAARHDAHQIAARWAVVWHPVGDAVGYLRAAGFRYGYRVGTVTVYHLS